MFRCQGEATRVPEALALRPSSGSHQHPLSIGPLALHCHQEVTELARGVCFPWNRASSAQQTISPCPASLCLPPQPPPPELCLPLTSLHLLRGKEAKSSRSPPLSKQPPALSATMPPELHCLWHRLGTRSCPHGGQAALPMPKESQAVSLELLLPSGGRLSLEVTQADPAPADRQGCTKHSSRMAALPCPQLHTGRPTAVTHLPPHNTRAVLAPSTPGNAVDNTAATHTQDQTDRWGEHTHRKNRRALVLHRLLLRGTKKVLYVARTSIQLWLQPVTACPILIPPDLLVSKEMGGRGSNPLSWGTSGSSAGCRDR